MLSPPVSIRGIGPNTQVRLALLPGKYAEDDSGVYLDILKSPVSMVTHT